MPAHPEMNATMTVASVRYLEFILVVTPRMIACSKRIESKGFAENQSDVCCIDDSVGSICRRDIGRLQLRGRGRDEPQRNTLCKDDIGKVDDAIAVDVSSAAMGAHYIELSHGTGHRACAVTRGVFEIERAQDGRCAGNHAARRPEAETRGQCAACNGPGQRRYSTCQRQYTRRIRLIDDDTVGQCDR